MRPTQSVIGVFSKHEAADAAVRKLASSGVDIKNLSVVGKGYHTEETHFGFYNVGERMAFWGQRGAFWGGLWGFLFGGVILAVPVVGHVIVLGYLATAVISALEGAVIVGGVSAVSAALYSVGVPQDSVVRYDTVVKADGFLVVARGSADEAALAARLLREAGADSVEAFDGAVSPVAA